MEIYLKQIEGKVIQIYPIAFKRKVIEEYLATGVSKMDLLRKYGIKSKSGIQRWMKSLGYADIHRAKMLNFRPLISSVLDKEIEPGAQEELEKRIRELERLLEDEQLRSELYLRIIDKAEKEFKIPIRKKPNTK